MADAVGVVADEGRRVDAADQQVAGVEAPAARRCARARARRRAAVSTSVPTCGCSTSSRPRAATRSASSRRCSPARFQPSSSSATGADQSWSATSAATNTSAPARGELGRGARARARASSPRSASCTTTRHEAADEPQPVAVEHARAARAPSSGSQPSGPSSVAVQPERGHLRQHALGRQLQAPARDLADAPRDRARRPAAPRRRRVDTAFHASLRLLRTRAPALERSNGETVAIGALAMSSAFVGAL